MILSRSNMCQKNLFLLELMDGTGIVPRADMHLSGQHIGQYNWCWCWFLLLPSAWTADLNLPGVASGGDADARSPVAIFRSDRRDDAPIRGWPSAVVATAMRDTSHRHDIAWNSKAPDSSLRWVSLQHHPAAKYGGQLQRGRDRRRRFRCWA